MAIQLWWIIQKDLICEYRARRAWPRMLLLGLVVVVAVANIPFVGGLLRLLIGLAGMGLVITTVLPLHHPVDLAEVVSSLDIITGGNMALVAALGYRACGVGNLPGQYSVVAADCFVDLPPRPGPGA